MIVCLWNKQTKPDQTQSDKPKQTQAEQTKNHLFCLFFQTKQNQTFSTINSKLAASNEFKSKIPEKLARAAQPLYRPVLV